MKPGAAFWRSLPDDDVEAFEEGVVVRRNTFPDYAGPEYQECFRMLNYWRGGEGILPFAGGWAEQPAHVIDVIDAYNDVYAKWDERQKRKHGGK